MRLAGCIGVGQIKLPAKVSLQRAIGECNEDALRP